MHDKELKSQTHDGDYSKGLFTIDVNHSGVGLGCRWVRKVEPNKTWGRGDIEKVGRRKL